MVAKTKTRAKAKSKKGLVQSWHRTKREAKAVAKRTGAVVLQAEHPAEGFVPRYVTSNRARQTVYNLERKGYMVRVLR